MEISIREATANDYNSLCELFNEIDALHRDNLPHFFQKPYGAAREKGYYLELIADENVALLVAEVGKNVYEFNGTAISFYEKLGYQTFSRKMSKELKKEASAHECI